MLRRLNLFLQRGSASKTPKFPVNTYRVRNSAIFTSSSPFARATSPKAYVLCAVGGLVVASSIREENPKEDMAPLELPGRPGNLTDEQTIKLKEMWSIAFKVFGIPIERTPVEAKNTESTNQPNTNASDSNNQKGGKLTSLFKKKKDKESPSPAPSSADLSSDVLKLSIADGEDKYSQTKDFKDALATSTPQEIHDTFWRMVKADHPDSLFLRFLRARKWDVSKAIVMLVATMRWRNKELDVRSILFGMLIIG